MLSAGNSDGFVEDASLIFASRKKTDDYHDNMDANLFMKWFSEKLLPNLKRPSIIILDNASYHCRLKEKIPNRNANKDEIVQFLTDRNIECSLNMMKVELLQLLETVKNAVSKRFEIDELAYHAGHRTLRLPPYHCQFNPIELVWANCKQYYNKNIGRDGFGDDKVLAMWEESLSRVDAECWTNCIGNAEKKMNEWWETLQKYEIIQQPVIITLGEDSDSDEYDDLSSD